MFYFVFPKKKVTASTEEIVKALQKNYSEIKIQYNPSLNAYNILWKVEQKQYENVGFLDFYYGGSTELYVTGISLEFEYKFAAYIDFEEVIRIVLKAFKGYFGKFDIYDTFLDRTFNISPTKKDIGQIKSVIAESRKQAYTQGYDILQQIVNNTNVSEVLSIIDSLPQFFSIFTLSGYIAQLKRANANTQERIEQIITHALGKIENAQGAVKKLLTFKLLMYYRGFSSSYLDLVSQKFLATTILPLVSKLQLDDEAGQFLLCDIVLQSLSSNDKDTADELITELFQQMKDATIPFILFPEMKAVWTMNRTGNSKKTFQTYVNLDQSSTYKLIRERYIAAHPQNNSITHYRTGVVAKKLFTKLSFTERISQLPIYLRYTKSSLNVFLLFPVLLSILISIYTLSLPFLLYATIPTQAETVIFTSLFAADTFIGIFFIAAIAGLSSYYVFFLFFQFIKRLQKYEGIRKTGFQLISGIAIGLSLITYLLFFGVFAKEILKSEVFASTTESIFIGTTIIQKSTISELKITATPGTTPKIHIHIIRPAGRDIFSFSLTPREKEKICRFVELFALKSKSEKLNLIISALDGATLRASCNFTEEMNKSFIDLYQPIINFPQRDKNELENSPQ